MKQQTLATSVEMEGVGLHSGRLVSLRLCPAKAGSGITFVRTDITEADNCDPVIPARWDNVSDTRLCTVIANAHGISVGTVEHLMAALRGCGIDNARIELDGPEVPVMDGSSAPFIAAIDRAGIAVQNAPRTVIEILKEIEVKRGEKYVRLSPHNGFAFSGRIAFAHPDIGDQRYDITLLNGNFRHDIAEARTFGFLHEVRFMREQGLALGGSLENAVVLDEQKVLNSEGLRYEDEFIRHKLLDAIGDLYLAGAPVRGLYEGNCPGHALNNALLHALFADKSAYRIVTQGGARKAVSGAAVRGQERAVYAA